MGARTPLVFKTANLAAYPLAPCPAPVARAPQLQESSEWEGMVDRAYEALDRDGCGRIGPQDLEELLCGEDGCEVRGWGGMGWDGPLGIGLPRGGGAHRALARWGDRPRIC